MEERVSLQRQSRAEQTAKLASLLDALDGAVAVHDDEEEAVVAAVSDGAEVVVEEFSDGGFNVGDMVFAMFYVDGLWYKARVEQLLPDSKYLVLFVDYGNLQETVAREVMTESAAMELAASLTTASSTVAAEEDPSARAERILLELTPYGTCRNCGGTIMMSDNEICLICGGKRLEPGEVRPSEVREAPPPQEMPVSPRRATMLDKIRAVVQKDESKPSEKKDSKPSSQRGSAKEEEEEKKKEVSLLARLRGPKKEEEQSPAKTASSGARFAPTTESDKQSSEQSGMLSPRTRKSLINKISGGLRLSKGRNARTEAKEKNKDRKVGFLP